MGYIFQNYFLMPELTAIENVLLPAFMGAAAEFGGAVVESLPEP